MKIYDKTDRLILDIVVNDNSYRNRAIMGDHNLTLYYSLPTHVEIPVGSYCEYEGTRYFLLRPEQLKMKHTRLYDYTVTFSSEQDKAKIWKFRNPVDGRLKFPLTAKPKEHLQMFVDNMNRRDSGWTVGECIDDVETLISYDHDYCWDALTKQATTFKTEFEIVGKRVSLRKVEYSKSQPLPLSYGRGNGFKSGVGRSNSGDSLPTEILFVQGGDRNIDRSKYPASETLRATSGGCLLLPVGQTIGYDGEHFENEDGYNPDAARHYIVDDLGLSIRNIDKELSTLAEDSLDRSDDYPKRVGTISQVVEVDKDKNFYDFIDSSIPADLNYEDYLIGEEQMTVVFQSGELAGREFDVKYYHEPKTINGKNKTGRRFEIVAQEIDGMMMPGGSFVPKPGDTYAVFNVMLPDAYIRNDADKSGASWDMFRAAVKHLFDNEQMKFSFTGELDGIWAKKDWINIGGRIRLGGFVRFTNEQFEREGVLVRITNIKDYINNPHKPKITLSNETVSGSVSSTLKELQSTEVVIDENHRAALQFTKRRFRDAKETIEMIEAALSDNFTNRINPIAVETMSLLVGDERLQYQFVAQPGSTEAVPHNIEWSEETKQLVAPAGTIQHLTLGIDSIRPSHEPNEYLYWNVASFESASLTDGAVKYYLYIRAVKQFSGVAGSAEFRLETVAHKLEEGNYYWLLVGVLNTEYDGERSFATLYGFTEILPGRITADRLLASDGQSYFDMLNAAMKLKDKLQFNIDGDGELKFKGVMVQSQNGIDESPLGCYRGEYNAQTTYFNGDEVVYRPDEQSPTSSYRCISPTPITGVPPTNTLSWQVSAAGVAGEPGKDGKSPALVFRGNYSSSKTYYGNASRVDCVFYGSAYYVARTDAPNGVGGFSNKVPTNTDYWNQFGSSFEGVATGLLLTENANIANLIFRNQRLESLATTNGVPNFFIDGLKNIASFAAGKVVFDGTGARIGWIFVDGKDLVGVDNDGIERLRITPNALPSVNAAGKTTDLVVKAYGGSATYIGETPTEVAFEYAAFYDEGCDDYAPTEDNTLYGYVEYDIAENSTRIDFGDLQGNCQLKDFNGNAIPYNKITTSMYANVLKKNGNSWDLIGQVALSQGQVETTIPTAGRIRIAIYLTVYVTGYSLWNGTLQVLSQGLQAKTAKEEVFIAKNGFMAIYNANYLRFHSGEGLIVRVGNYGLRVTTSGVQKTTNGGNSWSTL